MLQVKALDLNALRGKTAAAQADAFKQSMEEVVVLMEKAKLVDARVAELLRRFLPTCAMNDRASPARAAARLVLAKYVALCSSKGYAIGQKFLEWIDARLADVDGEDKLLGCSSGAASRGLSWSGCRVLTNMNSEL